MDNKTELRIIAKSIRKTLDMQNISHKLCEKIKELDEYKFSQNILLFYPLEHEVNLLELINNEKNFYLPKIKDKTLEICPYQKGDSLKLNNFKIQEPLTKPVLSSKIDLIILPALAADIHKNRLGYGKGFYDRLLENTKATTVLPLPKVLIFEQIPTEEHDKTVDILLTV